MKRIQSCRPACQGLQQGILYYALILLLSSTLFSLCLAATPESIPFQLTEAEQQTAAKNPLLYVAVAREFFPIEYYNETADAPAGIIVDLLTKVSQQTGITFQYFSGKNDTETLQMVKNLQVDLATTLASTDELIAEYHLTRGTVLIQLPDGKSSRSISLLYTSRIDTELQDLLERALTAVSKDALNGIIISNAMQYEMVQKNSAITQMMMAVSIAAIGLISISYFAFRVKAKKLQQEWQHTDTLTGYGNMAAFREQVEHMVNPLTAAAFCVLDLTLSNMVYIRDAFGYEEAENAVRQIAHILQDFQRENETFARAAGDDFILLLQFTSRTILNERLYRLINDLRDHFIKTKAEYRVIPEIGIYCLQSDDTNFADVMHRAMQARKAIEKDAIVRYVYYDDSIREKSREERLLEQEFFRGMQEDEFVPYIQPKVSLRTGRVVGGEVLARWQHPRRGLLKPGHFIPVLEHSDLILDFDIYMFARVCKIMRERILAGKPPVQISCNFSRAHFFSIAFCEKIKGITDSYQVPTEMIEIEVTESIATEYEAVIIQIIRQLKNDGFHIALDDFGSGYSSFANLSTFLVDYVKLDKSLIDNIENLNTKKIIQGIVNIAHSINAQVVCEGVETLEQIQMLKQVGCDIVQGFYYYQPMPFAEFETILSVVK